MTPFLLSGRLPLLCRSEGGTAAAPHSTLQTGNPPAWGRNPRGKGRVSQAGAAGQTWRCREDKGADSAKRGLSVRILHEAHFLPRNGCEPRAVCYLRWEQLLQFLGAQNGL